MKDNIIKFIRAKDYKLVREIGQGGTGKTVLLEDEIISEKFVCKKYSPAYPEHKNMFFENFKDEIRILHLLNHQNIVRVFNYYLYPKELTGYILMEFVDGQNISQFLKLNPELINDIFKQTINGFLNLEKSRILHRDIRPDNLLVSNEGVLKIIDFGFSKKIEFNVDFNKSISLNWRYSPPSDFKEMKYDFETEIYFVGKLFEEIIIENGFSNFKYQNILNEMVYINYEERISSFFEINRRIISLMERDISFTNEEKIIYQIFAESVQNIFSKINSDSEYISEIITIIRELQKLLRNSALEDYIVNPQELGSCFIKGNFRYWKNLQIKVEDVSTFLNFFSTSTKERQKVILNNLWQRLDRIEREESIQNDDLPF